MMRSRNTIAILAVAAINSAVILSAPATAYAQDAVPKVVQLNKKAMESYDILEFEAAKKSLLDALAAAKKGGLDSHPVTARTHIHLGVVYINGFKDRFKGFQQFIKAIQVQPTITLDKNLATAELKEVFESALEEARGKGMAPPAKGKAATAGGPPAAAPTPVAAAESSASEGKETKKKKKKAKSDDDGEGKAVEIEEPDLPASISALDCPNADEAPPEADIALRCAVAPGMAVSMVILFYRPQGQEEFVAAPMVRSKKGWWNGVIPGSAVEGKSLHFYFEGRDKGGKALLSNGRNDSPNLMLIVDGASQVGSGATAILDAQKSSGAGDTADTENPLEAQVRTARVQLGARAKRGEEGYVRQIGDRRFWIGLAVGSGIGFAASKSPLWGKCYPESPLRCGPESRQDLTESFNPGLAPAMTGHAAPEIGVYITPRLAVAAQGRNQYIRQPAVLGQSVARGAHLGMLRVLYFNGTKALRFYGAGIAGGGEGFRLQVKPDAEIPDAKDTVRGGGFMVLGAGGGVTYDFSPWFAVVAEVNALVGMPLLSAVMDLNVGVQLGF